MGWDNLKQNDEKPSPNVRSYILYSAVAGLMLSSDLNLLHAASDTWVGSSSTMWSNPANWASGNVPGSGDTATFNQASSNTFASFPSGLILKSLLFDTSSAPQYDIGSDIEKLTLNDDGAITINSTVLQVQTINASVTLGTASNAANYTISNNSDTTKLWLEGGIRGSTNAGTPGAKTLTINATGDIEVKQSIYDGASALKLVKEGSGRLILGYSNIGSQLYTGGTIISQGTLQLGTFYSPTQNFPTLVGAVTNNGSLALYSNYGNSLNVLNNDISGTGSVSIIGVGTYSIGGNNSYTGTTYISSGILKLNSANAIGTTGNVVFSGGTVELTTLSSGAFADRVHNTTLPILLTGTGDVTGSFDSTNTGGMNISGTTNTVTLSGNNTFTGPVSLLGGILKLGSANALGTNPILFKGGTLAFSSQNTNDIGAQIKNATGPINLDTNGQNVTIASVMDSSNLGRRLYKYGQGTLELSGDNTFALYWIQLYGGELLLSNQNALGVIIPGNPNDRHVVFMGGTLKYSSANQVDYSSEIYGSDGAISIDTNGQDITFATAIPDSNKGGLTKLGAGTLTLAGYDNRYTGTTTITSGTLQVGNASPNLVLVSPIVNNASLVFNIAGSMSYSQPISGTGPLTKVGSGTVSLGGTNTYQGTTLISEGKLRINGTLASDVVNQGALEFSKAANITYTYSNTITGSGSVGKFGSGTVVLSGNNQYTGKTFINAGSLQLGAATALGATSEITFGGGTLRYSSSNTSDYSSIIRGSTSAISIDMNSQNITYTTALDSTNTGGLSKLGAGTLTLSANSSYAGPTIVSEGKLVTSFGIKNGSTLTLGTLTTAGVLEITAGGGTAKVTSINGLVIPTAGNPSLPPSGIGIGSHLELHDNDLIIGYVSGGASVYSTTVTRVKFGLKLLGGAGTDGITSAEVDNQTIGGTVLAVVDDGNVNVGGSITSISGYTIPNPLKSVLVKYTWFGDANLDGVVNGSDYALLDTGFTSSGTRTGWLFGDFDYSGTINAGDYALIDTGFIAQTGAFPEPAMLGLILLSGAGLLRRRR